MKTYKEKQAKEWEKAEENKLGNEARRINYKMLVFGKKITFCVFFAGQASERVSLVTRASEEEILDTTWRSSKKEMDTD